MRTPVEKMQAILLRLSCIELYGRKCLGINPETALLKVTSWEELNFYYDRIVKENY